MKVSLHESLTQVEKPSLFLNIFLDEDWSKAPMHIETCTRSFQAMTQRLAKVRTHVKLDASGEWSVWKTGQLRQTVAPHFWYFAADDCGSTIFTPWGNSIKCDAA